MHILKEKFGSSCTNVEFIFFFFFLEKALCLPPWEEQLSVLHPLPHQRGQKLSAGEAVFTTHTCMSCAYSSQAASIPFFPLSPDTTQKAGCVQGQVRCLPEPSGDVDGVMGSWALSFSPGVGRMAGTLGNRAARGEAAQAIGGMFSSCPL